LFGDVVIKVTDDSIDNDLATNEIRVLQHLQSMDAEEWRHFPQLLDSFTTDGRKGLVFRRIYGPSLLEVRKSRRYRAGVHRKDMVWMLNRALRAANYFHALGVIHGNIEPSHMMIQPIPHNLIFVDWSYAAVQPAKTGEGFKVHTEVFSPPEVLEKKPPIPASDIYSIGKVMIWLLGGNPRTNEIPEDVEEKLARLLLDCVTDSPQQRPQSAWKLQGRLINTIEDLWGPRKYRKFDWDWDDVDLDIDVD
jgi:serine/threonine protein kinase